MKKLGVLFISVMVALSLSTTLAIGQEEIEVVDISAEVVKGPDSSGDVFIMVYATVNNNTDREIKVLLKIHGVDEEGNEVTKVVLRGRVDGNDSRTLSRKTFLPFDDYQRIETWELREF